MRNVKFRAWDNANKKMTSVTALFWNTMDWHVSRAEFDGKYDHTDFSLMQHTGLKDKNGNEIYEGDVVYLAGYGEYLVEWPFVQLYQSSWEDDVGSILGNIYENPELLNTQ